MRDRLIALMRTEGLTAAKLAEITHVQPSTVSHIMSGRNNPGYDFLAAIMRHYPLLNARWLMLGEGDMYNPSVVDIDDINDKSTIDSNAVIDTIPEPAKNEQIKVATEAEQSTNESQSDHIEKIVFFNSDGTFTLYDNSDI